MSTKILEEASVSMFAHEADLPSLPVPELSNTMAMLRSSVSAIFNVPNKADGHKNAEAFREFRRKAVEFESDPSQGQELHRLLQQRAQERRNWLEDWWLDYAYLAWPQPVALTSSYQLIMDREFIPPHRDGSAAKYYFGSAESAPVPGEACSTTAAVLTAGFVDYAMIILREHVPVDMAGKTKLCMNQYRPMFTTYRWPGEKGDRIEVLPPSKFLNGTEAVYVVVMCGGLVYKLPVTAGPGGERLSVHELAAQMRAIMKESARTARSLSHESGVGALTADERPRWAANVEILDSATRGQFRSALNTIQNSLFVVCLDPHVNPKNDEEVGKHTHSGDPRNRWYDKVVQVMVFGNGRAGLVGEHSPMDAGVVSDAVDQILLRVKSDSYFAKDAVTSGASQPFSRVDFGLSPRDQVIRPMLKAARSTYNGMVDNNDLAVLNFPDYGAKWLRADMGVPPDSLFQLAMQLAIYRLYGRLFATYETASTRKFFHGRTDVCRSATPAAQKFVERFTQVDLKKNVTELNGLFQDALNAHRNFMLAGVNGTAIDRHLLGMRFLAKERAANGGPPVPALLEDPCVVESSNWRLSTSTVLAQTFTPGFAAVASDGFGICYAMRPNEIRATIMSYKACRQTSSSKFRSEILKALRELRDLIILAGPVGKGKPAAKL